MEEITDLRGAVETLKRAGLNSWLCRQRATWYWGGHSGLFLHELQQPTLLWSEQTSSSHQSDVSQLSLHTFTLFWTLGVGVQHHTGYNYTVFHMKISHSQRICCAGRASLCLLMKSCTDNVHAVFKPHLKYRIIIALNTEVLRINCQLRMRHSAWILVD